MPDVQRHHLSQGIRQCIHQVLHPCKISNHTSDLVTPSWHLLPFQYSRVCILPPFHQHQDFHRRSLRATAWHYSTL